MSSITTGHTAPFHQWRTSHTEVSSLYWSILLGYDATKQIAHLANPTTTIQSLIQTAVPKHQMPEDTGTFLDKIDNRINFVRLALLTLCSAHFEDYLTASVRLWLGINAYTTAPFEPSDVGNALGGPAMSKSNIHTKLEYIEKLFGISFGDNTKKWQRYYQMRCVAAHVGGILTKKDILRLSIKNSLPGDRLLIEWPDLHDAFSSAHVIAKQMNDHLFMLDTLFVNAEWQLFKLFENGSLPDRMRNKDKVAWILLHNNLSIAVPKSDKLRVWQAAKAHWARMKPPKMMKTAKKMK